MIADHKRVLDVLGGARIVATLPLESEHRGFHRHVALRQIDALRACGAEIFPFDVAYSQTGDSRALFSQIRALSEFKPELVLSTGGPPQVLRCRTGRITLPDGWFVPNNLFVDHLGLPTILMWDTMSDFLTSLRAISLAVDESQPGMLERARDQIKSPLFHHLSSDQQHIDCLRELGVLTTTQASARISWALPVYADVRADPAAPEHDVIFAGNLFMPPPVVADGPILSTLMRFRNSVLSRFEKDINFCYWDAVTEALGELDPAEARAARLDYDQSFFWSHLGFDLVGRIVTQDRLAALRAVRRPVDFYGLLHDPKSASLFAGSSVVYRGVADFETGLPSLFARSKVTLDVVTAWFPTAVTTKVLNCFLAGGLCLFNAKTAFRDAFGSVADQVMYRDLDDMQAKLDYFLTHDRERAEIAGHLRRQIEEQCSWVGQVAEMVAQVKQTHGG